MRLLRLYKKMIFTKKTFSLILLTFVIFGIIVYSNIINSFFLSDDFYLLDDIDKNGFFGVWTSSPGGFFRPLISLSLLIDYKVWGFKPIGYHLTNIFFHSLNSFLVFLISFLLLKKTQLLKQRIRILSLCAGFIFLLHPCHTEAVSWISGRTDIFSTLFCLASFSTYLFYKEYSKVSSLLISFPLFLVALFAKESVIIFPLVILAYESYGAIIQKDNNHKLIRILFLPSIYCIFLVVYLFIRNSAIGTFFGGYGNNVHTDFDVLKISIKLILYFIKILFPYTVIKIFIPNPNIIPALKNFLMRMRSIFIVVIPVLFLVILIVVNYARKYLQKKYYREIPHIFYFLLIVLIVLLLPVINLGFSIVDSEGERFIYLPSVFFSILIVTFLDFIVRNIKYFMVSSVCILMFYGISLYWINHNWKIAGEISNSVLLSIKTLGKADRLVIINLPDNIKGAFIYRNGIREAIRLFGAADQFQHVTIVSHNTLYEKDDGVGIEKRGESYFVRLLNPKTYFMYEYIKINANLTDESFKLEKSTNSSYFLTLRSISCNDKIVYYSIGRMLSVNF